MTGSIMALVVAMLAFVGSHLFFAGPRVRAPVVVKIGERAFRSIYSVLSLALLAWVVIAYRDAPIVDVWSPPIGLKHSALLIMPFASILLVAGLSTPNPAAIGGDTPDILVESPVGILKVTRHPVMWGFALWAIAHLLANGDVGSLVLFGGMGFLALAGAGAQDRKKRKMLGEHWEAFTARTSFVPFVALFCGRTRLTFGEIGWRRIAIGLGVYALLLWLHPMLFGVSPLPL